MFGNVLLAASDVSLTLSNIVTSEMVGGVMDEIVGLLPIVIPVSIGYIGLRKGIGFLFNSLKKA